MSKIQLSMPMKFNAFWWMGNIKSIIIHNKYHGYFITYNQSHCLTKHTKSSLCVLGNVRIVFEFSKCKNNESQKG